MFAVQRTVPPLFALGCLLLAGSAAHAQYEAPPLSGRWEGRWTNSRGGSDYDSLHVVERPGGYITGVWGKGYHIQGEQVGPGQYVWHAFSEGSRYRAKARLVRGGDTLLVDYSVRYWEDGEWRTYFGDSVLHRARW